MSSTSGSGGSGKCRSVSAAENVTGLIIADTGTAIVCGDFDQIGLTTRLKKHANKNHFYNVSTLMHSAGSKSADKVGGGVGGVGGRGRNRDEAMLQIFIQSTFHCLLSTTGDVYTWGSAHLGQLGLGFHSRR